jgi:hypothetical protein
MLALSITLGATAGATAAVETAGYSDFSYSYSGVSKPTGEKPQSKLWFNDGRWWGSLFNRAAGVYRIYWLDTTTQTWIDTGTGLDNRPDTQADCMWDAASGKLYIASGGASKDAVLYRYSYNSANKQYSLDAGFPVTIRPGGAETIVLDKDATGQLWVTYVKSSQVYINFSNGSDSVWGAPVKLNPAGTKSTVSSDDISSLITVNNKVIVLWSNQTDKSFYYAYHNDADPDTTWSGGLAARDPNGAALADDHINLKSLQADASGNIFAVVKTSINSTSASSPQIILLVAKRQANGSYTWQPPAMVSSGAQNQTRAILLIDTEHRTLNVFTANEGGGSIYHKQASIDNIQFPSGYGNPFISSSTYTSINDASSTKQNLNSSTGLVVLASDDSKKWYLHNYLSLGGSQPPADTTPPTVVSTTPASNATNVSPGASVTATFSEPLNASTVTNANFTLSGPAGAVAANVTYNSGSNSATLQPASALAAGASYTAQLSGVKDLAGNSLASIYSWSFTTAQTAPPGTTFSFGPVADTYVSQASPGSNYAANSQLQAVGGGSSNSSAKQIYIRFDVSGLPAGASVSSARLRLYVTNASTSGGTINAISNAGWAENITWNTKPTIDGAQLAVLGAVAVNTAIEVDLGGAINGNGSYSFAITLPSANTNTLGYASRENSAAGNRPQLVVATGGTAPADTTPPTVSATTPANASSDVSTNASVTATFSEPLDASTVTNANFTLSGPAGAVAANVTYNSGSNSATLQPASALAAGASYTAQLSGVKDLAGNSLASTYSWSFTTAQAGPPGATFSFGPVADTFVVQNGSTSYAAKTELQAVGGSTVKEIYIRFDVIGLPAGASVSSAKLRLYVTNDSTSGGIVQSMSNTAWAESVTWNFNKPEIDGPVLATIGAVAINTPIEVNLGGAITGNGSYSFGIKLPSNITNTVGYASREHSTSGNRPQLVITTT